jgi:predicted phosphodiesterase
MKSKIIISKITLLTLFFIIIPVFLFQACSNPEANLKSIRFGVCADVHKDIMHDSDQRLQFFIDEMNQEQVDFIIQLGDFCRPSAKNDTFMTIWNSYSGPTNHVIGNHEMDGGFSREQVVAYFKIPAKHYSFDKNGFHFIVLDGNDKTDPPQTGYARFIGLEQQQWLKKDLSSTELPTIIFSHQSIEDEGGVENGSEIRRILENANQTSAKKKVIACFSGHHHIDYVTVINGIYYLQVNSMSYSWLGENYLHIRYSKEIDEKYPAIKYTAPYKDPIFAIVTINSDGSMKIEGKESEWVGPSPKELGYPTENKENIIVPGIKNKLLNAISN